MGGWNANILLNVDWLKRYLFPNNETFKVEMPVKSSIFGPPQISTDSVKLSLTGPKLSFTQLRDEDSILGQIEELVKKVSDFLPHTPVSAIGINFLFEEKEESGKQYTEYPPPDFIKKAELFGTLTEQQHRYSFSAGRYTLNLTIRETSEGMKTYDFNYHHKIKSLPDIKEIFAKRSIIEYKDESERKVTELR